MRKKKIEYKNLGDIYAECWNFIKESKKQIYFAIGLFIFFVLIGFFIAPPKEFELQLIQKLKEIAMMFSGASLVQTIWMIFSNNIFVCFLSIILGILFGIFPFLILVSNGYLIGYVAQKAVSSEGILILWRLFPHGIFELPAVLISAGLGLKLGASLFNKQDFRIVFKKSMLVFICIVLVLLLIAAIIEGTLVFFIK